MNDSTDRHDPDEGIDPNGMITTGVERGAVSALFEPVLHDIVDSVGPDTSVFLYGSVATGQATRSSDIDLLTIDLAPHDATTLSTALSNRYADRCRGVEVGTSQTADFLGDHDQAYGNRVFLRHYCVQLSGPPHRLGPAFRADRRAARGFNGDIARHASRWKQQLRATNPAVVARCAARKTLLAVAGLVGIHDSTWTTSRRTAAERWPEIEPDSGSGLASLASWVDDPPDVDQGQVENALHTIVADVVAAFDTHIGLWQ